MSNTVNHQPAGPAVRTAATLAAIATIVTVVTQIAYVTVQGETITAQLIWGTEVVAFAAVALFGLAGALEAPAHRIGWSALALFGLFNTVQAGMGLTMFGPLQEGGEALAGAFQAVLAGAFFFYFAGKVMVGIAALSFGLGAFRFGNAGAKTVGALAALSGIAALGTNLYGMVAGREGIVQTAGATGTAAALFVALAILLRPHATLDR